LELIPQYEAILKQSFGADEPYRTQFRVGREVEVLHYDTPNIGMGLKGTNPLKLFQSCHWMHLIQGFEFKSISTER